MSLYQALTGTARDNFNVLFAVTLPSSFVLPAGAPQTDIERNNAARKALFDGAGAADPRTGQSIHVLADFLTLLPKARGLFDVLTTNATHANHYLKIFGARSAGWADALERQKFIGSLFNTVSSRNRRERFNFKQTSFLNVLKKVYQLFTALQADPKRLGTFNRLYFTNLPRAGSASESPTAFRTPENPRHIGDITFLFNMAGDPKFNLQKFLRKMDLNYRRGDENFERSL
ncbi:MAG: hypothetical protein HY592_06180 [Candidatus Omnitrophica bacterium]|nr:hypothetical protein [Candidatus Omnitrophota bacterium]